MKNRREVDPAIVDSMRSEPFDKDGHRVEFAIYKLEDCNEWSLEVIDEHGTSTVWDEVFSTDEAAWQAFLLTVAEEGIEPLVEPIEDRWIQ